MVDCDHGGGGPAEADQGVGLAALRHCLRKEEELGFQSCEEAVLPERPTENVAGVNLFGGGAGGELHAGADGSEGPDAKRGRAGGSLGSERSGSRCGSD